MFAVMVSPPGSLAHGGESNERLVYGVSTTGDKYLFAFTSRAGRKEGVEFNEMRSLIFTFMGQYSASDKGFRRLTNLDGGGSIYLSWNTGTQRTLIARGNVRDDTLQDPPPTEGSQKVRAVANLLKFPA